MTISVVSAGVSPASDTDREPSLREIIAAGRKALGMAPRRHRRQRPKLGANIADTSAQWPAEPWLQVPCSGPVPLPVVRAAADESHRVCVQVRLTPLVTATVAVTKVELRRALRAAAKRYGRRAVERIAADSFAGDLIVG